MPTISLYRLRPARFLRRFAALAVLALAAACSGPQPVAQQPTLIAPGPKTLAVLPLRNLTEIYGSQVSVRCPICGSTLFTDEVAENAVETLTDQLIALMRGRDGFEMISPNRVQGLLQELLQEETTRTERQTLMAVGHKLNADYVMVGYVYRYRDRVGKAYSVQSPASVAFELHMLRVDRDTVVWSGHFDETQQSLFENLFQLGKFLERKGAWVTAEQMSQQALKDLLDTIPGS